MADVEPLDNPIWHALTGPQAMFSEGTGLALRFEPEVAVFAALPDQVAADAWDALRALVGNGGAIVARPQLEPPPGWRSPFRLDGFQMIAPDSFGRGAPDDRFVRLTNDDVPEMLALVERTRPGPFAKRTIELGPYYGLRDDAGELVAMSGTRMRLPGYAELSAVCTDPALRGKGIATALMETVAAGMRSNGEQPMLHVAENNSTAIALYEHLGFVRRSRFTFALVQPPE
ncbi:MAG TPA: GNAT family N-acetyltransferase [Acidimicrobiia bacterium]|jgi:ribosomal protein S18 acetylase RimI-like enzyme|nr:GNAT family N-acetyltransferase [Acidimicrobiia bacterium]